MKHRLFVSLNIPEEIKEKILESRDSVPHNRVDKYWLTKNKFHCTLKFIGDVDHQIVLKIIDELNFLENYSKLFCELEKFGFFYHKSQPSILWMGMKFELIILEIVKKINQTLVRFEIEEEKKNFNGHITLLRLKEKVPNEFIEAFKNFKFNSVPFYSDSISLYESSFLNGGHIYKELKKYKLRSK